MKPHWPVRPMAVDLKGQPSNREAAGTNGCLGGIHRHDHCLQHSFGCYRIDTLGNGLAVL